MYRGLGKIFDNNASSSDLDKGARVEAPLWLGSTLAKRNMAELRQDLKATYKLPPTNLFDLLSVYLFMDFTTIQDTEQWQMVINTALSFLWLVPYYFSQ